MLISIDLAIFIPLFSVYLMISLKELCQKLERVFNQVSKHLEVRLKNLAAPRFFYLITCRCLEILVKHSSWGF